MPQRIAPTQIVTVTKDGECNIIITLELNINLNTDGSLSAVVRDTKARAEEEKVQWQIPEFISGPKLDFGKSTK